MRNPWIVALVLLSACLTVAVEGREEEPQGPAASGQVQATLDEAARLLKEKAAEASLGAAERALAEAVRRQDAAGEASARAAQARVFEALERNDDALAAWAGSASVWARLAAGPERIETLCARAALLTSEQPEEASSLVGQAVQLAQAEARRPRAAVAALNRGADLMWARRAIESMKVLGEVALAIGEKLAPGSLVVAKSLHNLGNVALAQGDLAAAGEDYLRALGIREKLAPGSLEVTSTLNNLGLVSYSQGDLATARRYYLSALEIREKLEPDTLNLASSLNNLGNLVLDEGDLAAARGYQLRALEIREKQAPGSLDTAQSLHNLGNVAQSQGNLVAARGYYLRALEIQEKLTPGSVEIAAGLNNLGLAARIQGDLAAARDYYLRALEIREKLVPGSLKVATTLDGLGGVAYAVGDLTAARDYHARALEIEDQQAPGSLDVAASLNNLGNVAYSQGDLSAAHDYQLRALEIREKQAPGSQAVAASLNNLGSVVESQGQLAAARGYYLRALEIHERHAPGSLDVALTLFNLGTLDTTQGDHAEAERRHSAAWRIVREERRSVSGDEAGRGFAAGFTDYATRLVEARIALGKNAEAFDTLEEARAQGLLQLLSERGLGRSEVDPVLWSQYETSEQDLMRASSELAATGAEAWRLAREVEALRSAGATPGEAASRHAALSEAKREAALSGYTQARLEQERILGEVRRAVPGLAARTFSFEEARRALPPKSVFVAWSLGEEKSAVFVIPSDPKRPVEARMLDLGEVRLAGRVAALRERIESAVRMLRIGGLSEPSRSKAGDPQLVAESRALYAALFPAGAKASIESADRVILSPDGALWELPFAMLVTNARGTPAWLGLDKPLSYTPSLTVLAVARESAPDGLKAAGFEAIVVGDPVFVREPKPAGGEQVATVTEPVSSDSKLRGERALLTVGGMPPERLPATAGEARGVAALYGVEPLLGESATESAVRSRLPRATVVHLATHGYFHPKLAMSSGVLLAPPDPSSPEKPEDDGALQAWEFGRTLPLSAELVVLSACETGRGEKVLGEGLVGLTRALQAAGARSVVATQWKVADESTAELMMDFHGNLRRGLAKDEALRRAMSATAGRRATSHPFFWAPFILTGDADRPLAQSWNR